MMKRLAAPFILALNLAASYAHAAPVTVEYNATVKFLREGDALVSTSDATGFNISVGEVVKGYFSYDTDTQMVSDGPNPEGQYLLVGDFSQALKFVSRTDLVTFNHQNYLRTYDDATPHLIFSEGYDSAAETYKIFSRFERFGEYINSHGFLPEPELWTQFNGNNYFDVWYQSPDAQSGLYVSADITSFRVIPSVPEPATCMMLVSGLGLLAFTRRKLNA